MPFENKKEEVKTMAKKKQKEGGIISRALSVLLVLVVLGGLVLGGMQWLAPEKYKPSNWGKGDVAGDEDNKGNEGDPGGMVVTPVLMCDDIDLRIRSYSAGGELVTNTVVQDANGNEVTAYSDAIQSCTIEATVLSTEGSSPSSIQSVTWTYSDPNEYDGLIMNVSGTSATFTLLEPFSKPITVTITSAIDTTISTTVQFDYARRISNVNIASIDGSRAGIANVAMEGSIILLQSPELGMWGNQDDSTNMLVFNSSVVFDTVGTVCDEILSYKATILPSKEMHSKLRAKCDFCQDSPLPITYNPSAKGAVTEFEQGGETHYQREYAGAVWFTDFASQIYGIKDWNLLNHYASPPGWFRNIKELAEECTNEYVMTVEIQSRYGGTYTQQYYLDFQVTVGSINTNIPSYTW